MGLLAFARAARHCSSAFLAPQGTESWTSGEGGVRAVRCVCFLWKWPESHGKSVHLSCRQKLQRAVATRIMTVRRDRWIVQPVIISNKWPCQAGAWAKTVHASKQTTMLDMPHGHPTGRTEVHLQMTSMTNRDSPERRSRCGQTTPTDVRKHGHSLLSI